MTGNKEIGVGVRVWVEGEGEGTRVELDGLDREAVTAEGISIGDGITSIGKDGARIDGNREVVRSKRLRKGNYQMKKEHQQHQRWK